MGDSGQVAASAAEVYDEFFLPALFASWPPRVLEAAGVAAGDRVADVACGTGVLAAAAARAVAPGGSVVGIDSNPGMLAVARRKHPEIEWIEAPAEKLPLETGDFDAVVSQFGLMFFTDRPAALREMWRVLRPGGRLVVAVWDSLRRTPGYAAVTALLADLFDAETAALLEAPYCLGDPDALRALCEAAGIGNPEIRRCHGEARFGSIRSWMHSDVRGWTLAERIDDAQFERLVGRAESELCRFVGPGGEVRFDHPALLVIATRP